MSTTRWRQVGLRARNIVDNTNCDINPTSPQHTKYSSLTSGSYAKKLYHASDEVQAASVKLLMFQSKVRAAVYPVDEIEVAHVWIWVHGNLLAAESMPSEMRVAALDFIDAIEKCDFDDALAALMLKEFVNALGYNRHRYRVSRIDSTRSVPHCPQSERDPIYISHIKNKLAAERRRAKEDFGSKRIAGKDALQRWDAIRRASWRRELKNTVHTDALHLGAHVLRL